MAKLIHLIGTSGSGKSSVHMLLNPRLKSLGYVVVPLVEPGPLRTYIQRYRQRNFRDAHTEAVLFAADRSLLYADQVFPRLSERNLIFSFARGLPDSIVYQGIVGGIDPSLIFDLNRNIPRSDVYLALVVDGNIGYERICNRSKEKGVPVSPNENPTAINLFAQGYRQLSQFFSPLHVIDTSSLSIGETTDLCFRHIQEVLD